MTAGRALLVVVLSLAGSTCALVLDAETADAFCRTRTSQVPADFDPATFGECWTLGLPLYWASACVSYDLQKDASKQISYDDAAQGIATAFSKWTGTVCPTSGSAPGRVSIDVRDLGPVECSLVQYNQNAPNQHVIVFRDESWPYTDGANALALTTVTYDVETGEIFDADMEINSHTVTLSVSANVPADGYDFESIVTHETGHFLGMAHSGDTHATMYAYYAEGHDVTRQLTADDVSGICSIYEPDGTRTVALHPTFVDAGADAGGYYASNVLGALTESACDPTPRHGFSTQCASTPGSSCSLALGVGAPASRAAEAGARERHGLGGLRGETLPVALSLGALPAVRARRRRRRTSARGGRSRTGDRTDA